MRPSPRPPAAGGKLRIGDDWNAITITRARERGEHYLEIVDDGRGVPRDGEGAPDFRYVATHICDSLKRRLKAEGARGVQGEFGIGLLSFWTVGEELAMSSAGADGHLYEMRMRRHDPGYSIARRRALVEDHGTRLKIRPLLPGVRQLSGEKIQRYLASELRERIRQSGVKVRVLDRQSRKELAVEPRQFTGELLHHLPAGAAAPGEIYVELYLAAPDPANEVGLYRSGTRILRSILRRGDGAGRSAPCRADRGKKARRGGAKLARHAACDPEGVSRGDARAAGRGLRLVRSERAQEDGGRRRGRGAARRRRGGDRHRGDRRERARATKALKLRYLIRLYAKEMVRRNFPGLRGEELLDRLIELSLYTEEHLR